MTGKHHPSDRVTQPKEFTVTTVGSLGKPAKEKTDKVDPKRIANPIHKKFDLQLNFILIAFFLYMLATLESKIRPRRVRFQ
jgi:hypothetical protein